MIAVADYGMGNLRSVQKAFELLGFDARITDRKTDFENASHIVLPGVGAFRDAAERVFGCGMAETLIKEIGKGKPFLGICLGMHLLFEKSYEGGEYDGFGVFEGTVTRFVGDVKVPQIGWNALAPQKESPMFRGVDDLHVYFVHSYHVNANKEDILATTEYGQVFPAAVSRGHIFGMQFHPEKSGDTGLKILKNFGGLA